MSDSTGWIPDPYGVHEFRFFSADGKPTLLVMDGGKRSYDKPPTTSPRPSEPTPTDDSEHLRAPSSQQDPTPANDRALQLDSTRTLRSTQKAKNAIPMAQTDVDADHSTASPSAVAVDSAGAVAAAVPHTSDETRVAGVEERQPEPVSRVQKIAYGVVLGVLVLSLLGLAYVHLRPHGRSPSKSALRAATTTSTAARTTTTTTTTTPIPPALQSGPEAAATALISSWSTQNRATALTVATPAAVTTLFAAPYTAGLAIDRGCSTSFVPIVCTFGPPGGASPTDPIYQVYVSQAPRGWYVSSVKLEN